MGKRYYCLYCDSLLAANPNAIRTHCAGLAHQRLRSEHYQRFKDAETILNEEKNKKPCSRFARGDCMFGGLCHFSHYSREQILELQEKVAAKLSSKENVIQPAFQCIFNELQNEKLSKLQDENEGMPISCHQNSQTTVICPWPYPALMESCQENLPPSLQKIQPENLSCLKFNYWG